MRARVLILCSAHLLDLLCPHGRLGPIGAFAMSYYLDPPLRLAVWLFHLFGGRLLLPFCSTVAEGLLVGSVPLPSDVEVLARHYRVCAVVWLLLFASCLSSQEF